MKRILLIFTILLHTLDLVSQDFIIIFMPVDMKLRSELLEFCSSHSIVYQYFPSTYKGPEIKSFADIDLDIEIDKKRPMVEFKISPGLGFTWGIFGREFDFGPSISVGWEITF